ncbi:NlpC/P60 family protein [Streptomyces sp. NPDC101249]|uniref:C40 family peptidase n=1 Tax=Streptomyces sp. NPDC101249 TaxID=3366140 RepID=UPI00380964D2
MAAHRKPSRRSVTGGTARAALTLALAGVATATAFDGTGHADPEANPAQVRKEVDRLYRQAESATEKYNGAKETADAAGKRLGTLRDEAARRTEDLNTAREALGSYAAAQYRDGGLDPSLQLMLSSSPDRYLDGAEFARYAGGRQAAAVGTVRQRLREIGRLRGAARVELRTLKARQAELDRRKKEIDGKLRRARALLAGLPSADRALVGEDGTGRASRSGTAARTVLASSGSGTAGSTASAAPNARSAAAVAYAYAKLGSPYVWGATGPNAFDCSGLVQAAYRAAGVSLPRTTYAQIGAGRRVSRADLRPGDLVFFYSGISHVGIYVGGGRMIHAPNPSAPVRLAPVDEMPFAGATRVV